MTFLIEASQRTASEAHFRRLHAFAFAVQSLQFFLNGSAARLNFKGALHVPYRRVEVALVLTGDGHADVRNEIVGDGRQHALKNIGGVYMAIFFQQAFRQHLIGFQVFGVDAQDVFGMSNRLIHLIGVHHPVNFF